jgi:transcriptional regulator with XRE-family HTH domain
VRTYEFSVIASGIDPENEDAMKKIYESGCDDATVAFQRGVLIFDFAREAKSPSHAILSAIWDVTNAGAKVERIEPDPLVSLSEIAKRTGLTRASISNYAHGNREKDFPVPIARVTSDNPLWDWVQVVRWLAHTKKADMGRNDIIEARVVRDYNLRITEKRIKPRLKKELVAA